MSQTNMCVDCFNLNNDLLKNDYLPIFREELLNFLRKHKQIIFAFSGGLDSVITLHKLNKLLKKYNNEIKLFTIDNGYKNQLIKKNIENVLEFEGLIDNHQFIQITKEEKENYARKIINSELPCGKFCNQIINSYYKMVLEENGEEFLFTGGDTPKYNESYKKYSIFWKKKGFTVIRGSIAFGLTKKLINDILIDEKIPWVNPHCGGYDTDCLIPGFIFRKVYGSKKLTLTEVRENIPILIDFFSERIRWGLITKEEAINRIINLEVTNDINYNELLEVINNYNN